MAPLSEWLQLMLAEIARKQEEARRGATAARAAASRAAELMELCSYRDRELKDTACPSRSITI